MAGAARTICEDRIRFREVLVDQRYDFYHLSFRVKRLVRDSLGLPRFLCWERQRLHGMRRPCVPKFITLCFGQTYPVPIVLQKICACARTELQLPGHVILQSLARIGGRPGRPPCGSCSWNTVCRGEVFTVCTSLRGLGSSDALANGFAFPLSLRMFI